MSVQDKRRTRAITIVTVAAFIIFGVLLYWVLPPAAPDDRSIDNNTNSLNESTMNNDLQIEVLADGSGDGAKVGDTVSVHYTGTLQDGTAFDSSRERGQPFTLTLGTGSVIQGWEQGLLGMKQGEQRKLTIPPELGYGASGFPPAIPPNATLVFEVEMLAIQ